MSERAPESEELRTVAASLLFSRGADAGWNEEKVAAEAARLLGEEVVLRPEDHVVVRRHLDQAVVMIDGVPYGAGL